MHKKVIGITALLAVLFPPLAFLYIERLGLAVLSFIVLSALWCLDIASRHYFTATIFQGIEILSLIGSLLFLILAIYLSRTYSRSDSPKWYAQWKGMLGILLCGFILAAIVDSFFYGLYKIPSESMQPNFQVGDYVLVEKFPYGSYRIFNYPIYQRDFKKRKQPKRGEVFVFYDQEKQQYYIKRIIALSNDKLAINGASILINSHLISRQIQPGENYLEILAQQQYLVQYTGNKVASKLHKPLLLQIPEKHYFLMGDNRNQSIDSRFIGPINADALVGRVVTRF